MALKSILVVCDAGRHAGSRIDYAAALADRHDAHVTGLFIKAPSAIPPYVMSQIPEESRHVHDTSLTELARQAHALFEDRMRAAGRHDRAEWRVARGQPNPTAALMARYADIVVAGQRDPDEEEYDGAADRDELVLSCGRPVLLVPYAYRPATVAERIVLAWNASREAARAVADAMPLLERARGVTVLCVNPGPEMGEEPGADIALHLARHGVKAEASHVNAHDIDSGDALLSRLGDLAADLLVMGAYGRPRLRELVLGGVTRHVLRHMTVPVLMSH